MTALHDFLGHLAGQPLGTVVHVHPSEPELADRYAALGARRVVLVSGDPDALPGLRRLLPGRPWLTLLECVVAPEPGQRQWLRYNVAALNGLLPAGPTLQEFYPRLRLHERVPVAARSLQSVLDDLHLGAGEGAHVLVLEAPGLEDELLHGLQSENLAQFEWLLVRGAQPGLLSEGIEAQVATGRLKERGWRDVQHSAGNEPLWPVTLLHFDVVAAERAALLRRVEASEAELKALAEVRASAEQRAALQQAEVAQLTEERNALKRQVGDLSARMEAAATAQDAAQKAAAEHQRRMEHVQAERDAAKAALDKAAAERASQIEQMGKARDEYAKQASERQKRIVQLEADLADLSARHGLLQEELIKSEAHVELIADLLLRESLR